MIHPDDDFLLWLDVYDIFPEYENYVLNTYPDLYAKALEFSNDYLWRKANEQDQHRFSLGYLLGCLKYTDMMTFTRH